MPRTPGAILNHGAGFFNFIASRLPLIQNNNLCMVIPRNFSSGNSVVKTERNEKHLQRRTEENNQKLSREELVQKISELTFSVKNHRVVSDAIVSWHPEVPFPYEMSKPLPLDVKHSESNLKIQSLHPVREVFRKKYHKNVVKELMHLTYTTKHRWFGRFGMERRLYVKYNMNPRNQKRAREYL